MKLENLLNQTDLTHFKKLVAQAHQEGAGAVRMYVEADHIVVIGIAGGGELLTWFASPAHSLEEAVLTERVVLSGIQAASMLLNLMQTSSAEIATNALKKASKMH